MTILDEIVARKRGEVEAALALVSGAEMAQAAENTAHVPLGFRAALLAGEPPAIIAELKRRSPSRGEIRPDFDAVACAKAYRRGGAAAISVLTDEFYFGGHLDILREVRAAVDIPLLRKDFMLTEFQVDEARCAGADAILLIVAALDVAALSKLYRRGRDRGLDVLVEVHDEAELEVAMGLGANLIGVNNRNLHSFEVDLAVTERLAARVAGDLDVLLVAESGIHSALDMERLGNAGARGFLVGESLMREPDIELALQRLRGNE